MMRNLLGVVSLCCLSLASMSAYADALDCNGCIDTGDIGKKQVTKSRLAKNAVNSSRVKDDSLKGVDIKDGTLTKDDLGPGSVGTSELQDGAVTGAKIADGAVTGVEVANGAIDTVHLAPEAVTTPKLMAGAVTTSEIADGAVTGAKLAAGVAGFDTDCNAGLAANDEMVRVGSVCIGKYEASIWTARTGGTQITGAIPCNANGQDCKDKIFARSVAGVAPRGDITWFQAQAALANSGKRFATNDEWQMAVQGTQDPGVSPGPEDCNTNSVGPEVTGERVNCVSDWGTHDMVGNLWEWVADWVPFPTGCANWGAFSDDMMCLAGASTTEGPGALIRGGHRADGTKAGPFAVHAFQPSFSNVSFGFRGAR